MTCPFTKYRVVFFSTAEARILLLGAPVGCRGWICCGAGLDSVSESLPLDGILSEFCLIKASGFPVSGAGGVVTATAGSGDAVRESAGLVLVEGFGGWLLDMRTVSGFTVLVVMVEGPAETFSSTAVFGGASP